jgi:predicted  nucleic acid-binding Zn-ribbon protein
MLEEKNQAISHETGTPRWVGFAVVILAAVSLISLGVAWSASQRAQTAEQKLVAQAQTVHESGAQLAKRVEQAEASNANLQADLGAINDRLKATQGELARARKQSKQISEAYSKELEEMQTSVRTELASKASADEVNARVGALSGDISSVRGDLDATRRDLGMARGELGTLIARNHEEIEQLRRLGQRDYFEFTLERKGTKTQLGSITLELRGTNPKKHNFSVALYVDDVRMEKKNRAANEPIYFYTRGTRHPLELVVNQVAKNKITGYLSVPKAVAPASGSGY